MLKWSFFLLFIGVFGLTSCIEIVDDLRLNSDGSGTLNYNVNLSASKVKINSIFALDSLDGKKVPTKDEVKSKIYEFKTIFEEQAGIEDVELDLDFDNYLLKLKVDFQNVKLLQKAIKTTAEVLSKNQRSWLDEQVNWLSWGENKMVRSIPEVSNKKLSSLNNEERELLKQGSYISITRFDKPVLKVDNPNSVVSKNKLAVMVRTDALSLSQNFNLLENTIYLEPIKE